MNRLARAVRDAAQAVDARCGTGIKPALGGCYRGLLHGISPVRRYTDPFCIRLAWRLCARRAPLALHLGCGSKRLAGYVNVDFWITEATDWVFDVRRLPWPAETAALIESHHMIEHVSHRDVEGMLRDWRRVLVPGGRLVLETPDLDGVLREYLAGNAERLLSIFGRQRRPGDAHLCGYTPHSLEVLLLQCGFCEVRLQPAVSHQSQEEPVFRLECRRAPGEGGASAQSVV